MMIKELEDRRIGVRFTDTQDICLFYDVSILTLRATKSLTTRLLGTLCQGLRRSRYKFEHSGVSSEVLDTVRQYSSIAFHTFMVWCLIKHWNLTFAFFVN